jgi:hypothetical protein
LSDAAAELEARAMSYGAASLASDGDDEVSIDGRAAALRFA